MHLEDGIATGVSSFSVLPHHVAHPTPNPMNDESMRARLDEPAERPITEITDQSREMKTMALLALAVKLTICH